MNNINAYINEQAEIISNRLEELLSTDMKCVVSDAMKYSVSNGGKRIRPFLCMEFARISGGNVKAALDFGCAIEMIHTYSLIHDDLPCMDNDDIRRGKPSCHIAYGEENALLAGDALLTKAFEVIANTEGISDDKKIEAVKVLSNCAGISGMVGGQVYDLSFEKTKPQFEDVIEMYKLKTGALLNASALLGCLTSENFDLDMRLSALTYSNNIGIAFQIVDDILDVVGDEKELGKPVGSDNKNDKSTFFSFMGLEKSQEYVDDLTADAILSLENFNGNTEILKDFALIMAKRTH